MRETRNIIIPFVDLLAIPSCQCPVCRMSRIPNPGYVSGNLHGPPLGGREAQPPTGQLVIVNPQLCARPSACGRHWADGTRDARFLRGMRGMEADLITIMVMS